MLCVSHLASRTRYSTRFSLPPDDVAQDPQGSERFLREARAASALNHPKICALVDCSDLEAALQQETKFRQDIQAQLDAEAEDFLTATVQLQPVKNVALS